ncbi:MAG: D-alanyl-D-alanine carboxypeptidase family protein [Candidatus Fimimorpha sp.]
MNRICSFLVALSLCTYLWNPVLPETVSADHLKTEENKQTVEVTADAAQLGITAASSILMEGSTGTIIYENQADTRLSPASITKIMTLILIFDALKNGTITLEEEVTTSNYAKSMGGSQVFLEEGERQSVETMIKCIVVASANDASVAMAERIAGSEMEFVNRMNERAAGLGMTNTHFEDCCGLTDSDNHYSSARDVAIMSRELIMNYPAIHEYSTIWMQNITHTTNKGTTEFGLANTNKLLKQYQWATGLKTGSTSKAKYCLSATAEKDGVKMIAVIMACPNYKDRFTEAATLLNYGYANCKLYKDQAPPALNPAFVQDGVQEQVQTEYGTPFSYLSTSGEDFSLMEREIIWEEMLTAPIEKGQQVGRLEYRLNGNVLGFTPIVAKESMEKAGFFDYIKKLGQQFLF